jgi:hypothetical protein
MKFLQKILLITMIGVFTGNADVSGMVAVDGIITVLPSAPISPFAPLAPGTSILDFNSIAIGQNVPESL